MPKNYKKDNKWGSKQDKDEAFKLKLKARMAEIEKDRQTVKCPCCQEYLKEQFECFKLVLESTATRNEDNYIAMAPYEWHYQRVHNANVERRQYSLRFASIPEIFEAYRNFSFMDSAQGKMLGGFMKKGEFFWSLASHIRTEIDGMFDAIRAERRANRKAFWNAESVAAKTPKVDGFSIEIPAELEDLSKQFAKKQALVDRLKKGREDKAMKELKRKKLLSLEDLPKLLSQWLTGYADEMKGRSIDQYERECQPTEQTQALTAGL